MNKNQSLIKIRLVVPEKNAKSTCRVSQHEQKLEFDQDWTSSSWEKMQKSEKILKPYHEPVVAEKSTKKWENFKPCHEPKITL